MDSRLSTANTCSVFHIYSSSYNICSHSHSHGSMVMCFLGKGKQGNFCIGAQEGGAYTSLRSFILYLD